jgi:hypothetical protein
MMENTLGLFCLISVLFILKAVESDQTRPGLLILSGIFIFLASFSKGIPGLFPLSVPFLYWLTVRKKTFYNTIISSLIIIFVPTLLYFILFHLPQSKESLTFYVTHRLLERIQNNPTVSNRFNILMRIVSELILQILLVGLIIFIDKKRKYNLRLFKYSDYSVFFISIGLSASVPLMLTLVQRGFYLVPSFPYFGIGLSVIIAPVIFALRENIFNNQMKHRLLLITSTILFVFSITFTITQLGKSSRDKEILHDVYAIGNEIPKNSAVTITSDLSSVYVLECYFIRYFNISLFVNVPKEYYLIRKTTSFSDKAFEKLKIDTELYDIYKRK